jgi:methylthioribulose-1-phosphate dehydratase
LRRYGLAPRSTAIDAQSLDSRFLDSARLLAETGRELARRGWTPATSSNFSARVSTDRAAITISGRDKGRLDVDDIMLIDLEGRAVGTDARPSAETLLHTQLYRRYPEIGAVLHTHSHSATVMSRLCADEGEIRIEGYELLKAFRGIATHQSTLVVPVFGNTQDMEELAGEVDAYLDAGHHLYGYLIEGHGIYTWGKDMPEARRHLDAFEFLLSCELEQRRLRP